MKDVMLVTQGAFVSFFLFNLSLFPHEDDLCQSKIMKTLKEALLTTSMDCNYYQLFIFNGENMMGKIFSCDDLESLCPL